MDAIDGVPTPAQVERIRAELAKVQSAEPVAPEPTKPEPVVIGKELQKFLDEIDKYMPPPVPPWPYHPWQPYQPTITWTSDRIDLRGAAGVACGGGIPQSYGLTTTTDGTVLCGGWATNAPGTDSVQ